MSASNSKVVVDHDGDPSSSQKPVLFLGCLLETDLDFEVKVLDDLIQSRGNSRTRILIHPMNRPSLLL